jgi:alpha-mannosidase
MEELPVEINVGLYAGSDKLDVSVTLDNKLENHRVRVLFPTGINSDENYAGQPFDIVKRPKISPYPNDETHPNTNFVGIDGEGEGIAIINEGLYEYEHMTDENSTLALTLLRCTGEIGKYLGEEARTPEGQCIGKHTLSFAVYPYLNDHVAANVANEASALVSPVYATYQHHDYNVFVGGRPFVQASDIPVSFTRPIEAPKVKVPLEYTSFKIKESVTGAMVLSAFKAAQDGDGYVLRFYNCSEKADDVTLTTGFKIKSAALTDLAEGEKQKLAVLKGNKIEFRAEAKQIITIKMKNV